MDSASWRYVFRNVFQGLVSGFCIFGISPNIVRTMGAGSSSADVRLHVQEARKSGVQEKEIRDYCKANQIGMPPEKKPEPPQVKEPVQESGLQRQLVEMGFSADAACVALLNCDDLETAIQWLCDHPDCAGHHEEEEEPKKKDDVNKDKLIDAATKLLDSKKRHDLDADIVSWARAVVAVANDNPPDAARRWANLDDDYREKRCRIDAALKVTKKKKKKDKDHWTSAIKDVSTPKAKKSHEFEEQQGPDREQKLESFLRRADEANEVAKSRREDVTKFCREAEPNISTTTLEKVYLYLKEKVHNNEALRERAVRATIFGKFEIHEATGADLVPKLLELILIEEDELLLKRLIQQLFNPTTTLPAEPHHMSYSDDTGEVLTAVGSENKDDSHATARTALLSSLRRRREAVAADFENQDDRQTALQAFDAEAKVELDALDEKFAADGSTLLKTASEAEALLRGRLAAEKANARKALLERLEKRRQKHRQDLDDGIIVEPTMEAYEASLQAELDAFDAKFEGDCSRLLASAAEAEARARERYRRDHAAARQALEDRLRGRREVKRKDLVKLGYKGPKLEAALQEFDKTAKEELDTGGENRVVQDALDTYAALAANVATQRANARSALEERRRRRRQNRPDDDEPGEEEEEEEALDRQFDAVEKAAMAGLDQLSSSKQESCVDVAKRLCAGHGDVEKRLRSDLEKSRGQARSALEARLKARTTKDTVEDLERRFDVLMAEAVVGAGLLKGINVDDEAKAAAAMQRSATGLLERQAAGHLDLERRFAVERSRRAAQLRRKLDARHHTEDEVQAEWALLDQEANVEEVRALAEAHAVFTGQAMGWSTAVGKVLDPAATATLVQSHATACRDLSDRLARQGAQRRAALARRLQQKSGGDSSSRAAALADLDDELHRERWAALNELIHEQRDAVLSTFEVRKLVRGGDDVMDLHGQYSDVQHRNAAAFSLVMDGVRDGLKRANDESSSTPAEEEEEKAEVKDENKREKNRASAAALIHEHAQHQSEVEEDLASERAKQTAALRQRLRARWNKDMSVDDFMEDWAVVEGDVDKREVAALAEAHSRFCGEALGICASTVNASSSAQSMAQTMASLVESHDDAMRDLSKRIAADHQRKRAALLEQVRKRKDAKKNLGDAAAEAIAKLDEDLAADRRAQFQAHIKAHQAAVLEAFGTPQSPTTVASRPTTPKVDLRDMFLALCDDETAAIEARRKHEASCVERQRSNIERRLLRRKHTAKYAAPTASDDSDCPEETSLVAQIEQARRRQMMTHQLHTKRERDLSVTS